MSTSSRSQGPPGPARRRSSTPSPSPSTASCTGSATRARWPRRSARGSTSWVRLDFTVGEEAWTATRVVRRTKGGGASTAEARLVGPAGVVAGTAEEVTARVTELLGLTYDHFSRCVVLPQESSPGSCTTRRPTARAPRLPAPARPLRADGRRRAGRRAEEAKLEIARLDGRLAELSAATEDAVADAETRARSLRDLVGTLDDQLPVIAGLAADEDTARTEAASLAAEADRLAAVEVPGDVRGLTATLAAATATLDEAISAVERAELDEETSRAAVEARADRSRDRHPASVLRRREAAAAGREKGERSGAASGATSPPERAVAAATGEARGGAPPCRCRCRCPPGPRRPS